MHYNALNTLMYSKASFKNECMQFKDKNRKYHFKYIFVVRNVNNEANQMKVKMIEL